MRAAVNRIIADDFTELLHCKIYQTMANCNCTDYFNIAENVSKEIGILVDNQTVKLADDTLKTVKGVLGTYINEFNLCEHNCTALSVEQIAQYLFFNVFYPWV